VNLSVSVEVDGRSYLCGTTARMRRRHCRLCSAELLVSVEVSDEPYLGERSYRINVRNVDITDRSSRPVESSISVEVDGGSYL
jgi:hypothetical protein